jgi:aromatic ring-cleaving dioxygenase
MIEVSTNGIKYEWGLEGKGGMTIMLYPLKGNDNQDRIVEAKTQLRKDLGVTYIQVHWVSENESEELLPIQEVKVGNTEEKLELVE